MSLDETPSDQAEVVAQAIVGHANVLAKNLVHLKTFLDEMEKRQAASVERANEAAVQSASAAVASSRTARWAMAAALLSAIAGVVDVGLHALDRGRPVQMIIAEPEDPAASEPAQ